MDTRSEIQRLKALKNSNRRIAKLLGIHRNTVKSYLDDGQASPPILDGPCWAKDIDWEYIKTENKLNKVNLKILYEELSVRHALPSYSAFWRQCGKFISTKEPAVTVRINRKPGESVETDYAGTCGEYICPSTGEVISVELYVGASSYSSWIYAEFTHSQKLEDWIGSHNRMYWKMGGVPKFEITDNLKSSVTKPDRYDPAINKTFYDMAKHYRIAIDPADARKPKHKPNVEKAVDILQSDFLKRIRKMTFTSLHALNKELWNYLEKKNAEVMKDRGESRNFFFEQEKPLFTKLPELPYEMCQWKKAKVHPDCCIQFLKNFYTVPYRYAGKEVEIKFNSRMIYVYHDLELIKTHAIVKGHGHYIIDESDYPEKKIVDSNMYILHAKKEALKIGENVASLVDRIFEEPRFPLKNLRKVQAVLALQQKYASSALDAAAGIALERGKYSYHFLQLCTKNHRPKVESKINEAPKRHLQLVCLRGGAE